MNVMGKAAFKC